MFPSRWSHLARHGLLGTTLLGIASTPASAETCDDNAESTIGFTLGVQLSPRSAVIAGVEGRHCLSDKSEGVLRLELGGGDVPRLILGARARPFSQQYSYDEGPGEWLGLEGGVVFHTDGRFGGHLAMSYGSHSAYVALQARIRVTDVEEKTRTALLAGFAPWTAFDGSESVPGRPVTYAGRIVRPAITNLPVATTREAIAVRDHYTRSAQHEYSSVWSFLRLARELAVVGAPAHLIVAALDAADDEVRHAEACARAAGGPSLAALADHHAAARFTGRSPRALETLASEAWLEGCLNEGAAAEEARLASADAAGAARELLATIATDEQRHADLAWAVVTWIRGIAPDVVDRAIARSTSTTSVAATSLATDDFDRALARHGIPSPSLSRDAWATNERRARSRLSA